MFVLDEIAHVIHIGGQQRLIARLTEQNVEELADILIVVADDDLFGRYKVVNHDVSPPAARRPHLLPNHISRYLSKKSAGINDIAHCAYLASNPHDAKRLCNAATFTPIFEF